MYCFYYLDKIIILVENSFPFNQITYNNKNERKAFEFKFNYLSNRFFIDRINLLINQNKSLKNIFLDNQITIVSVETLIRNVSNLS